MARIRLILVGLLTLWVTLASLSACSAKDPKADTATSTPGMPTSAEPFPSSTQSPLGSTGSQASKPTKANGVEFDTQRLLVIAVSVDGLNPDAIGKIPLTQNNAFKRMIEGGSSTLNARTASEMTITLPNHTSILTGLPISTAQGGHGVQINEDTQDSLPDFAGRYVPGIFDIVHDNGFATGLFATKSKFSLFERSWSSGAPDLTGPDDGNNKVDYFQVIPNNADLTSSALNSIRKMRSGFVFIHLSQPDIAGHISGWLSQPYIQAVSAASENVARLLDFVDERKDQGLPTVMLLTSDHGGPTGKHGHSDIRNPANYRVAFLTYGSGVPAETDLYKLNPSRKDPGSSSVGYNGIQPIRNSDLANAVVKAFGLNTIPGSKAGAMDPLRFMTSPHR